MVARAKPKRMYRTMQGRMVDIEKLRGANENVQAVGNMKVNARGDVLGPNGTIVKKKEKVMSEYYETPKGKATEHPRMKTPPRQTQSIAAPKTVVEPKPTPAKMNMKKRKEMIINTLPDIISTPSIPNEAKPSLQLHSP